MMSCIRWSKGQESNGCKSELHFELLSTASAYESSVFSKLNLMVMIMWVVKKWLWMGVCLFYIQLSTPSHCSSPFQGANISWILPNSPQWKPRWLTQMKSDLAALRFHRSMSSTMMFSPLARLDWGLPQGFNIRKWCLGSSRTWLQGVIAQRSLTIPAYSVFRIWTASNRSES